MQKVLITIIRGYRYLVSPWFGNTCRFYPSCSNYAIKAIETHGAVKGCCLALTRIVRCHPWHPGGHDPVPNLAENK